MVPCFLQDKIQNCDKMEILNIWLIFVIKIFNFHRLLILIRNMLVDFHFWSKIWTFIFKNANLF